MTATHEDVYGSFGLAGLLRCVLSEAVRTKVAILVARLRAARLAREKRP